MIASVPDWLFYVSALCVTAVNRFVLAGLSAALPRVVDADRLVIANSLSPTAGTLAATAGGGLAFVVRLVVSDSDAAVVLLGATLYLCGALASLRIAVELLGPDPARVPPRLASALTGAARDLVAGVRHLAAPARREATWALAGMTLMRFCYGALLVMLLMLCRYSLTSDTEEGLALLGLALGVSGRASSRRRWSPPGRRDGWGPAAGWPCARRSPPCWCRRWSRCSPRRPCSPPRSCWA
ncbi:hypothetical protein SCALM49S_06463 [Streptomyces californicus]